MSKNESTSAEWQWDSVPSYDLKQEVLEDYLIKLFGGYEFYISHRRDTYTFWVPRELTADEKDEISDLKDKEED